MTSSLSCCETAGITTRFLSHSIFQKLGGYTFAIYLWQEPVFRALILMSNCSDLDSKTGVMLFYITLMVICVAWTEIVETPLTMGIRKLVDPFLAEPIHKPSTKE